MKTMNLRPVAFGGQFRLSHQPMLHFMTLE
jgi:hypothetical protein